VEYRITDMGEYLRADLLERETAAESEEFLQILQDIALKKEIPRILICVHSPHAIFRVEKYRASTFLEALAGRPDARVALVAKHFEVRLTQQYVEVLARLKKARLRSFSGEAAAVRWLTESREGEALDGLVGRPLR
jgi:hypothetical protein